jgi:hypothetical protein
MVRRIKTSKTLGQFIIAQTRQGILVSSNHLKDSAQAADQITKFEVGMKLADSVNPIDLFNHDFVIKRDPASSVGATDALDGVGDLPTYTLNKNFFESQYALDSINSIIRGLPLADGADAQDLVSVPDGSTFTLIKDVNDPITASELFVKLASFNRTFTDTPNIVDTPSLGFGMGTISDSASIADQAVVSLGMFRIFNDSITATDSVDDFVGGSQQNIDFDSASATDVFAYFQGWGRLPTDTITTADTFVRVAAYNPSLTDTITAAEAPVLAVGMTLADSATIVDLIGVPDKSTYTLGMGERDSISSPTDIATLAVGAAYSDIILMDSDVAVFTTGMAKSDSATPGELASLGTFKVFTDSVSAIDNEDSSGFSIGSTLPDTVDVVGTGDSASGSMQSYFAAEYVSFTEVYVQDSRHDI